MSKRIMVVPDTQIREGVPLDHLTAAGNYLLDQLPDVVVFLGDWVDCPSLSRFNTNLAAEGLRIKKDIDSGIVGMQMFLQPLEDYNANQRKNKKAQWSPEFVFITGNHDPAVRIPRLIEEFPALEGMIEDSFSEFLIQKNMEVVPFLTIKNIDGIRFCHYFQNPFSAKGMPISGNIVTCMKNVGFSFVQGHKQGKATHSFMLSDGTKRVGAIVGSFYQHDEPFMGEQGNQHWRGLLVLNEVKDGGCDFMEVSLQYLMENWL